MTGFSADWLRLREMADRRARDNGLLAALDAPLADRARLQVADLACGTGVNLRLMAPQLAQRRQHWTLIDHDPLLLAAARRRCAGLPGIEADYRRGDLAGDLSVLLDPGLDLVTLSALLDLVSEAWLDRLVALLSTRGIAFHAALTYCGGIELFPRHPLDDAVIAAFDRHQALDKGFGPALGPRAAEAATARLEAGGFEVRSAVSDWRLGAADGALQAALVTGLVQAAAELAALPAIELEDWSRARLAWVATGGSRLLVPHQDLVALPRR